MVTNKLRFVILLVVCLALMVLACGTSEEGSNGGNNSNTDTSNTDTSDNDSHPSSTDFFGPTISNVAVSGISLNGATVTWTTNEPATSQVKYGLTSELGLMTTLNSTLVTSHAVTMTGLTSGDFYYVEPYSKDASGNESVCMYENFYTSMQQNLAIGTSAQNSEQRATIRSASKAYSYNWGSSYTEGAADGKVFLIIDALVENIGSKSYWAYTGHVSLSDSDGFKYEYKSYYGDDDFESVELFPGQKTQGKVLFEIPKTATGLRLAYDFGVIEPCVATWVV